MKTQQEIEQAKAVMDKVVKTWNPMTSKLSVDQVTMVSAISDFASWVLGQENTFQECVLDPINARVKKPADTQTKTE